MTLSSFNADDISGIISSDNQYDEPDDLWRIFSELFDKTSCKGHFFNKQRRLIRSNLDRNIQLIDQL